MDDPSVQKHDKILFDRFLQGFARLQHIEPPTSSHHEAELLLETEIESVTGYVGLDENGNLPGYLHPSKKSEQSVDNELSLSSEFLDVTEDNSATEINAADEDPEAARLHAEAYKIYQSANELYKKEQNRHYGYIKIHSGVRSSFAQAALYEKYLRFLNGGPPANAANKPGKSMHEYGLAVDIIRQFDEDLLAESLETAGWSRSFEDEGWHFAASSIQSWNELNKKIKERVLVVSDQYGRQLSDHIIKKNKYEKEFPQYLADREVLQKEERTLRAEEAALRARASDLQNRNRQLKMDNEWLNREQIELNELIRRYNNLQYNACPNGNSYSQCDHESLKKQWLTEKNNLLEIYNRRKTQYESKRVAYGASYAKYSNDYDRLTSDNAQYERRLNVYKKELRGLQAKKANLDKLNHQAIQHRQNAAGLLQTIAGKVKEIRTQ